MPEDMPENMPEDMPDRMPEGMPDKVPECLPDRMPEDLPEDMPDRMPEDMPDRMPEGMPDRMPDKMSDRMPEDLPVTKCINVMVGITRSKVIDVKTKLLFLFCFPSGHQSLLVFPDHRKQTQTNPACLQCHIPDKDPNIASWTKPSHKTRGVLSDRLCLGEGAGSQAP